MAKKITIEGRRLAGNAPQGLPQTEWYERIGTRTFTWGVIGLCALLTFMFFAGFIFSDKMFFGTDTLPSEYMKRTVAAEHIKEHGEMPRWNPFILGGLPFVDAMHGDIFYPTALLKLIMPVHRALGWKLILHVFLAGVFMYLMLKRMKLHPYAAVLGALLYMFSPHMVSFIYGGHEAKIFVMALYPLMFMALMAGFQSRRLYHFILLGGVVGLSLLTSHIQMTYFALWGIGIYFIYWVIGDYYDNRTPLATLKVVGWFCLGIATGLGIGLVQLLPPLVYVNDYSVRAAKTGYEHAASWSMHPEEMFSLLIPEFGNYLDHYWGRNPFRLNSINIGLVAILLAAIRFMIRRKRDDWFFLGLALFGLFFAMGEHTLVHKLAYYLVPGVKIFRGPEMSMMLFGFGMVLLAAQGADAIFRHTIDSMQKFTKTLLYVFGGFTAVLILFSLIGAENVLGGWQKLFYPTISGNKLQALQGNVKSFSAGIWISILVFGGGAAAVYAYVSGKMKGIVLAVLLAIVAVGEMWRIDADFIKLVNVHDYIQKDRTITSLMREGTQERFRVFPLNRSYQANLLGTFGIESVGGFHDNEIMWYKQFRDMDRNYYYTLQGGQPAWGANPFLNLMNVKYYLYRNPKSRQVQVIPNPGMLPRVFIATAYEVLEGKQAIINRIKDPAFKYRSTIILEKDPHLTLEADTTVPGTVTITKHTGGTITIEADMARPGFVVLSENYFPYWQATIDGKETEIYKTDYVLRSVYVPAGKHTISMEFVSKPYETGRLVTWLSILLLLGFIGFEALKKRNVHVVKGTRTTE